MNKRWLSIAPVLALALGVCLVVVSFFDIGEEEGQSETERAFANPDRIVSLSPAISELLFEIGAGDRVIAVDQYSQQPESLNRAIQERSVQVVGTSFTPMLEKIVSLQPDVVLFEATAGSSPLLALEEKEIGLRSYPYENLDQMLNAWRDVGSFVNRRDAVETLVSEVLTLANDLSSRDQGLPSPQVLMLYRTHDLTMLSGIGSSSYQSDILSRLGADNVLGGSGPSNVHLSLERVLELDPDLIIEFALDEFANPDRDRWSVAPAIKAVHNKEVHLLAGIEMYSVGPSMREMIRALRELLAGWRLRQQD